MSASSFVPEHIPENGARSRVADHRAGVGRLEVPVQPHHRAQTAEVGAAYQQMFCIANDLKAAVAERNRALVAVREAQRRAMRQLVVIAARREAGGLEHCLRVGAISALLAQALGKSHGWCDLLSEAAPAHDIGNIAIPDAILFKANRLTEREWAVVRDHPIVGANLLTDAHNPMQQLAADVALNHHEKWDGSGYPARRQGTNIPLAARIVAVADFVDSLSLENHTRDKLADEAIFTLLDSASGAQFDPRVVRAMHAIRPQLGTIRTLVATHRLTFPGDAASQPVWHKIKLPPQAPVRKRLQGPSPG
jgi:putative two-component system response regulator